MLTWIEKPALIHPPNHRLEPDTARYEAEIGNDKPPYRIRVHTTKGKTFFVVSRGSQYYTTVRSLEKAKAFAEANYEKMNKN
jgi:hypothetical protein